MKTWREIAQRWTPDALMSRLEDDHVRAIVRRLLLELYERDTQPEAERRSMLRVPSAAPVGGGGVDERFLPVAEPKTISGVCQCVGPDHRPGCPEREQGQGDARLDHAFKPGDAAYGWERQCSVIVQVNEAKHRVDRHCGYPPEAHPPTDRPLESGSKLMDRPSTVSPGLYESERRRVSSSEHQQAERLMDSPAAERQDADIFQRMERLEKWDDRLTEKFAALTERVERLENAQEAEFTHMQHADLKARERLDALESKEWDAAKSISDLERRMGEVEEGAHPFAWRGEMGRRFATLEAHAHGQSNAWLEGKLQAALEAIAELQRKVEGLSDPSMRRLK